MEENTRLPSVSLDDAVTVRSLNDRASIRSSMALVTVFENAMKLLWINEYNALHALC